MIASHIKIYQRRPADLNRPRLHRSLPEEEPQHHGCFSVVCVGITNSCMATLDPSGALEESSVPNQVHGGITAEFIALGVEPSMYLL